MTAPKPEDHESISDMLGEVLDLVDRVVDRITDEEIEQRLQQVLARPPHNHVTRDIKSPGKCLACDWTPINQ